MLVLHRVGAGHGLGVGKGGGPVIDAPASLTSDKMAPEAPGSARSSRPPVFSEFPLIVEVP
jgi:hypothetical protein